MRWGADIDNITCTLPNVNHTAGSNYMYGCTASIAILNAANAHTRGTKAKSNVASVEMPRTLQLDDTDCHA